jgi:hypothetical protein
MNRMKEQRVVYMEEIDLLRARLEGWEAEVEEKKDKPKIVRE